jgi:SAM-dependent methyltransferase
MLRRARAATRAAPSAVRTQTLAWRRFWESYDRYASLAGAAPPFELLQPCLADATEETQVEPIYFFQDSWAFRKIAAAHRERHVDIGSHHKFVSLLATIVPTTMVDIRPLPYELDGLSFQRGSILDLPFTDGALASVSSLCVVEHIGLGRYGDELDPKGSEKAIAELKRVVAPGGDLYVSVPVDDENRMYFNAHRAFTDEYLATLFAPFNVIERRYIYGDRLHPERGEGFGTGCYHLRAPS